MRLGICERGEGGVPMRSSSAVSTLKPVSCCLASPLVQHWSSQGSSCGQAFAGTSSFAM